MVFEKAIANIFNGFNCKMMNKLAIVIPFYKIDFFEETIKSIASQTNRKFTLYIGNDASPDNPLLIIQKYFNDDEYHYFNYTENFGSKNLTLQWARVLENVKEEWFQILGDDDIISENFIEEFYNHYRYLEHVNVLKCNNLVWDEAENILFNMFMNYTSGLYNSADFFVMKLENRANSSLSEHLFRNSVFKNIKLKNYPLAWHSDDYLVLEMSDAGFLYFIAESKVYIREYKGSISGKQDNLSEKELASQAFYSDVLNIFAQKDISEQNKDFYMKFYLELYPNKNIFSLFREYYHGNANQKLFQIYPNYIIKRCKTVAYFLKSNLYLLLNRRKTI